MVLQLERVKIQKRQSQKAINNTVWRILVFFVLSIFILAGLFPWQQAGVIESPFVVVFDKIGIPYAADIINFVIITAVLSVANSGLYATSRMLWSMSNQGMISPILVSYLKAAFQFMH